MLRVCDVLFSTCVLLVSSPILKVTFILFLFDTGALICRQVRIGQNKKNLLF